MLLERRTIFLSSNPGVLSDCVQAAVSLLRPFTWQHPFIPILPPSMMDIVCAPMPFVFGVLDIHIDAVMALPTEEVVFVDLDNSVVVGPKKDYKLLPFWLLDKLTAVIQEAKTHVPMKHIRGKRPPLSTLIESAFVRFMAVAIRGFEGFIDKSTGEFDGEGWSNSVQPELREFSQELTASQMFMMFIHDYSVEAGYEKRKASELEQSEETQENFQAFKKVLGSINQSDYSSALQNVIIKSGWLNVADSFGQWQNRFLVLSTKTISLRRKENEAPIGVIPLNQVDYIGVEDADEDHPNCFSLNLHPPNNPFFLSHVNATVSSDWIDLLQYRIGIFKKHALSHELGAVVQMTLSKKDLKGTQGKMGTGGRSKQTKPVVLRPKGKPPAVTTKAGIFGKKKNEEGEASSESESDEEVLPPEQQTGRRVLGDRARSVLLANFHQEGFVGGPTDNLGVKIPMQNIPSSLPPQSPKPLPVPKQRTKILIQSFPTLVDPQADASTPPRPATQETSLQTKENQKSHEWPPRSDPNRQWPPTGGSLALRNRPPPRGGLPIGKKNATIGYSSDRNPSPNPSTLIGLFEEPDDSLKIASQRDPTKEKTSPRQDPNRLNKSLDSANNNSIDSTNKSPPPQNKPEQSPPPFFSANVNKTLKQNTFPRVVKNGPTRGNPLLMRRTLSDDVEQKELRIGAREGPKTKLTPANELQHQPRAEPATKQTKPYVETTSAPRTGPHPLQKEHPQKGTPQQETVSPTTPEATIEKPEPIQPHPRIVAALIQPPARRISQSATARFAPSQTSEDYVPSLGRLSRALQKEETTSQLSPSLFQPTSRLAVFTPIMIRRTQQMVEAGQAHRAPNNASVESQPLAKDLESIRQDETKAKEAKARADLEAKEAKARVDLEAKLQILAQNRLQPHPRSATSSDLDCQVNPTTGQKVTPPSLAQRRPQQATLRNPAYNTISGRLVGYDQKPDRKF